MDLETHTATLIPSGVYPSWFIRIHEGGISIAFLTEQEGSKIKNATIELIVKNVVFKNLKRGFLPMMFQSIY